MKVCKTTTKVCHYFPGFFIQKISVDINMVLCAAIRTVPSCRLGARVYGPLAHEWLRPPDQGPQKANPQNNGIGLPTNGEP